MKQTTFCYTLLIGLLAGCASTPPPENMDHLTERKQKSAVSRSKSPEYFGFESFDTDGGFGFEGKTAVVSNRIERLQFLTEEPLVKIQNKGQHHEAITLLNFSSSSSRINYTTLKRFGGYFISKKGDVIPYQPPVFDEVKSYAGAIKEMSIGNITFNNTPLYIRMAHQELGQSARGINNPHVNISLGFDVLSALETIQIDLRRNQITLASSQGYTPNKDRLMSIATIQSKQGYGLIVKGALYGTETSFVLDFASDTYLLRGDKKVSETKQISVGDLVFLSVPTQFETSLGTLPRIGRRLLEQYLITICPNKDVVYFEQYSN